MAIIQALKYGSRNELVKRALKSGPLPSDAVEHAGWLNVHENGLIEIRNLLIAEGVL